MQNNEYLDALGKIMGMELCFDDNNDCSIMIDESLTAVIHLDEEHEELLFLGNVADELPDPVNYSLVLDLLSLGYAPAFGTAPGVGRDPVSGMISAWSRLRMRDLGVTEFCEAAQKFMEFQLILNEKITGSLSDDAGAAPDREECLRSGDFLCGNLALAI